MIRTPMLAIPALLLGLTIFAGAAPARAQTAEDKAAAERLFSDAMTLMDREDYEGACPKFAESLRLDSGIGVMLHLADCYDHLGRAASAWATFREAEEIATRQGDLTRADVARRHAVALEASLSTLTITIAAKEPGLVVTRDGVEVAQAQLGLAMPVDPGPHVVAATAPDRTRWETTTHVPGEHASVTLTVPALEPAAVPPPSPAPSRERATTIAAPSAAASTAHSPTPTRRILALVAGGVGVAGLGVGTYFGLRAGSSLGDSNAGGNCVGDHCNGTGAAARNDALHAATASTIAFIAGSAAIAAGVVLWLTAPRARTTRVGLSGALTGQSTSVVLGGTF
jgi:serine/threonine-protein kinase